MNIKQLRYVTAIIATGSFSAAAAREGVSVQAVSKAMSELEGEIGEPLFDRASSGVRATALGRSFGVRARHVLKEYESLEHFVSVRGKESIPAAPLTVGFCCPAFSGIDRLNAVISTVTARALHREIEIVLVDVDNCLSKLRSGQIDALITIGMLHEPGIVSGSLGTMAPFIYMSPSNPLCEKSALTLEDINSCPVALARDFSHFNDSVCGLYAENGMTSELVEVGSREDLQDLFERRNGLSFVVGGNFFNPVNGFAIRPIAPKDLIPIRICLSSLPGSDVSYVELRHALAETKLLG